MKYYVLRCNEDGDVSLTAYSKLELENALADADESGIDAAEAVDPGEVIYDFASGSHPLVIIKGEAVIPKVKKTVEAWGID